LVLLLAVAAGGCLPSGSSPQDEQREPHFLTGKSRVNSMDYTGAVEAFEKAVEVNPRSASAHFELGLLYENNEQDFAAAIYHFNRFLQLRPNSEYAEIVQQRVLACKQELAKSVSLALVQRDLQHDVERLTAENTDLRQKLQMWQDYYNTGARPGAGAGPSPAPAIPAPPAISAQPTPTVRPQPQPAPQPPPQPAPVTVRPPKAAAPVGSYSIKSGDTPANIARKYGVRLDALLAANPGLDPRHLKIGQTVTIPSP
jgi:tetratricopeptide (TPR) repeat protein